MKHAMPAYKDCQKEPGPDAGRTRHKLGFKDYLGLPTWCNVVNSISGTVAV